MEDDDELTRLLGHAAQPPVATPDSFREVMVRYRKGRTRALIGALVAVTLLGPAVGMAVGRATAPRPVQVATGGASGAATSRSSGGSGGSGGSTESHGAGVVGALPKFQAPPSPKRLFVRTTADGVSIRAYLHQNPLVQGEAQCVTDRGSTPCPTPPPECAPPDTQLQTGLSDDGAVDFGYVPVNPVASAGPLVVLQASYFGAMEGDPAAWVALKADGSVAQVRVRYSDGATDEMAPVEGYAVLAHRMAAPAPPKMKGPPPPDEAEAQMKAYLPQGSAEALDANGAVLTSADLASVTSPSSQKCALAEEPPMPPKPLEGGAPPAPATATTAPVPVPVPVPVTAPSTTRP